MAWSMRVRVIESCSCKMNCRCTLGPAEPDQGWCSGAITMYVIEGESDGVDLTGTKAVVLADLPGDFLTGVDKAKLVLDSASSEDQRRELEAILYGRKGGVWAGIAQVVRKWEDSAVAAITIEDGDRPSVTVQDIGEIHLEPVKTEDGKQATLSYAPVAYGGFGLHELELAVASGTRFSAPEMRTWESLGYGTTSTVRWSS